MFEKFIERLEITGTKIQVCDKQYVVVDSFTHDMEVPKHNDDLYFCQGVKLDVQGRASDKDIVLRNHVSVDIDYMKIHKNEEKGIKKMVDDYTKFKIKEYAELVRQRLVSKGYDPTAIVYSGGGIHVYWFGDIVEVNEEKWRNGMKIFHGMVEPIIGDEIDKACINPARIMKLPNSFVYSRNQIAEVLYYSEEQSPFVGFIQEIYDEKEPLVVYKKTMEMKEGMSFDTAVKMLDCKRCLEILSGDEVVKYQKFNFKPNANGGYSVYIDNKSIGCWIDEDGKIATNESGGKYAPYIDRWLKYYGHSEDKIRKIILDKFSTMLPKSATLQHKEVTQLGSVFSEMEKINLDYLKTGDSHFDEAKLFARGLVTRIGAWSNMGKSKLAYWLTCKFIENDRMGMFFSTEVVRPFVLANILSYFEEKEFSNFLGKPYIDDINLKGLLEKRLKILDQSDGSDKLSRIRDIISKSSGVDFIIIDFAQDVFDYEESRDEYYRMSNYAMQIQALAQQYNIAIIDLSQLSNEGGKNTDMGYSGFIPFRGSGYLYHKGDVCIQLQRDKTSENADFFMDISSKKNKFWRSYDMTCTIQLRYNKFLDFRDRKPQPKDMNGKLKSALSSLQ